MKAPPFLALPLVAAVWLATPQQLAAADLSGTITYAGTKTGLVQIAVAQTLPGNRVLKLDGDGDFVRIPTIRDLSGSELTIQFWFRGNTVQSAVRQQSGGFLVAGWNNGHILSNDGSTVGVVAGEGITDGRWHHFVMVWKQNTAGGFTSYFDGKKFDSRKSSDDPIPNHDADLFIGAFNGTGEFTNGELDEVAVWRRALSEAEVLAQWNQRLTGNETGLAGYWSFDDDTANDLSPLQNHGELNGDALVVEAGIPGLDGAIAAASIAAPGAYAFTALPTGPGFEVTAYMDANGNGRRDAGEPVGSYAGNPFELAANKPGVDFALQEIPTITVQPEGGRRATGGEVTLTVAAEGTAPLTYQWKRNDQNLTDGGRVSGARSSQLRLTGLTTADEGVYTVTVSNAIGSANSDPAPLAIIVGGKAISGQFVYTGTQTGTVRTSVAQIRTGNKALRVDGGGDYAITTLTDLSGDELTIEFWFKGPVIQSAVRQQGTGWIAAGWNDLHILQNDRGIDGIAIGNATDGNWHHVAMTWKRNTPNGFASYLDGKPVAARDSSDNPIPNYGAQLYLGAFNGAAEYSQGDIDEVSVWRRALTAAEIVANFRIGLTGTEEGLAGYWNFDDGLGQDLSPYANHAELRGDAAIVDVTNAELGGNYRDEFAGPGAYRIESVPPGTGYHLTAFLDVNDNGQQDGGEPTGQYAGNPFDLTADKSGVDVTLFDPPVVSSMPATVVVAPGQTIIIKATVQGTEPLTYQWRKLGVDLADGGRIAGAKTAELRISNAELGDEAAYTVQVVNAAATVVSPAAAVSVTTGAMTERLVGHWKFDETEGETAADATGLSGEGILGGYLGDNVQWGAGQVGGALTFGGPTVSQYVLVENYVKPTGIMSASAWAWAESRPTWATILKNWGGSQSGQFHFGLQESGGQLSNYITEGGGGTPNTRETTVFPLGQWQQVAFVADGAFVRIYRNGVQVASVAYSGSLLDTPIPALGIGVKPNNDGTGPDSGAPGFWHGKLDDVGLWTRALSAAEINGIYLAGLAGKDLSQAVATPNEINLTITRTATQIEIRWNAGALESAASLAGPWLPVDGASSPYSTAPTGGQRYYRARQ